MEPSDILVAVVVVDDVVAMTRAHLPCARGEMVQRRPDALGTLAVNHGRTGEEIEREQVAAEGTVAEEVVFADSSDGFREIR